MDSIPNNREFFIRLPMRLQTSSKKKTALNLNVYRNLHFRSLSALKNKFHKLAGDLIQDIPPLGRIRLHYSVCPQTKGRLDVSNVATIVDKFFSDTLVEHDVIVDDNYDHLDRVSFGFGGLATEEHVLVTITEIETRKGNPMRILLDEEEIQKALEMYVETLGISGVTGVDMTADDDGNVVVEVMVGELKVTKPKTTRKGKGGRPAGSKNKPKEDPKDVDESPEDGDGDDSPGTAESAETETPSKPSDTKAGSGNSKNLFEESPGESSQEDDEEDSDNEEAESDGPKVKKSSIFDQ